MCAAGRRVLSHATALHGYLLELRQSRPPPKVLEVADAGWGYSRVFCAEQQTYGDHGCARTADQEAPSKEPGRRSMSWEPS